MLSVIQPAYIIYKFVEYTRHPPADNFFVPLIYGMNLLLRTHTPGLGSASIFTRILLIIATVRVMLHFGTGLRDVFSKEQIDPLLPHLS